MNEPEISKLIEGAPKEFQGHLDKMQEVASSDKSLEEKLSVVTDMLQELAVGLRKVVKDGR